MLKIGDVVRIKSWETIRTQLDSNDEQDGVYFDNEMIEYCGRIFKIVYKTGYRRGQYYYTLSGDGPDDTKWAWIEPWLELLSNKRPKR